MLSTRTKESLKNKEVSAGQLIHFGAMQYLRDRGKYYYDFGGCPGPVPIKSHPNYGVWRFKHEFNGIYGEFLPYYRKSKNFIDEKILTAVHKIRGDYM
jgi:lipid II:glycine glycyltransferase (peptidoglycan interpeptide bridge formation enzyme)